jgi:hypothetical protein
MKSIRLLGSILLLLPTVAFLHACGGSGGSSSSAPTATVTGSVYAAPVEGATVVVLNSSGTTMIAGPVTTSSDGTYSVSIPTGDLSSDLIFSSNSGTYKDEATGNATPAKKMAAYAARGSLNNGSAVNLDPASTIIADLVKSHGKTLTEANTIFSGAFGYTPDISIAPKNTSTANLAERLAALRAITYSQLTKDLGLSPNEQFELLTAIAEDLADGVLDGANASTVVSLGTGTVPEDIENRFEQSLVSLLTNPTCNKTGLTTAEIGSLPFGKVALTTTYKVEYLPGMMSAAQGKTAFKIRITNRSDDSPAPGLTISLMPMMHMPTMSHSAPVDGMITDNGDGTYSCTVYYLMASGMGMGYWELKVTIGGMMAESATFYPSVGMAMGSTTVRATLRGQSDLILSGPTGIATEARTYYLFNDSLTGMTGNYTFKLFIAAKESMMSYPAVSAGTMLHDEQNAAWTVNTMTVEASTDGSTWTAGTDNSGGHWTISSLSGLTSGSTGTVYVRMAVNGEQKTTNGSAPSGANGYATFTVTPGM